MKDENPSVSHLLLLLLTLAQLCTSLTIDSSAFTQLYVIPFASLIGDHADGSLTHPYSSIQQALDHIEQQNYRDINAQRSKTINLYPTHYFVNTLRFTHAHSHTRLTTMNSDVIDFYEEIATRDHTLRRLSKASISGGIPVTGWTQVATNTYNAVVSQPIFVNQLFADNRRVVRSRVPMNLSDYLYYAAPLNDSQQGRCGFQYQPGQFDYKSLTDAMVVVYHSWTTSHHYIDHLIPDNNTLILTNPSGFPLGMFPIQGNKRFHIENLCEALIPNSFCFVNATKTVTLMTDGSYDPNKVQMITSVNEFVVQVAGIDANQPVTDIIIDNVAIQHSAWNIDRNEVTDEQATAFLQSAPLYIANATHIIVSNTEVSHTGSYGIWIREGTTNINIMNSLVTDTGSGGIRNRSTHFSYTHSYEIDQYYF
jgi:hypothetical protein